MLVIGVVGGVASGKSAVSEMFQTLGAASLDADKIGHEVLNEPAVVERLRARWGPQVVNEQGEIDRSAVARRVFANNRQAAEELAYLESLTHPLIGERIRQQLATHRRARRPAVLLDAPLLLEANLDSLCDVLLFVDADIEVRRRRANARGWTDEEFARREASQIPLTEKRQRAEYVISTNGSLESTQRQVHEIWRELMER